MNKLGIDNLIKEYLIKTGCVPQEYPNEMENIRICFCKNGDTLFSYDHY